ncbi:hypothetical protein ACJJTC_012467 [Scirpophaga incertulas]
MYMQNCNKLLNPSLPVYFIFLQPSDDAISSITIKEATKSIPMELNNPLGFEGMNLDVNQPSTSTYDQSKKIEEPLIEDNVTTTVSTYPQLLETPVKRKLRRKLIEKTLVAESRKMKLAVLRSKTWRLNKDCTAINYYRRIKNPFND